MEYPQTNCGELSTYKQNVEDFVQDFTIANCGGLRPTSKLWWIEYPQANCRGFFVTGANKGIGLEIVEKLASNGIKVVLTARDEKRDCEAVEKLKEFGASDQVVFISLMWMTLLVNNVGIGGTKLDGDVLFSPSNVDLEFNVILGNNYDLNLDKKRL
ncbi:hypothetical protein FNV43_RR07333 [Rhamnella rubrinervis]|uniref:Uncharacterized protein n=1 Tax=Rhamnella rubrinervis TaxID=2594499 RepID=A0A8K0MML5_9ROSA|nr:hypothetical protein FNV43_RR07333 [Rhamnella rubrinervis]